MGLLRYNSHTMQSPNQNVQLNNFEYIHRHVQPSLQSNFRTFSSPQKEILYSLAITPLSPLPAPNPKQPLISFLSLQICPFWTFTEMEAHDMWSFVTGLFLLAHVFEVHLCCSMNQNFLLFVAE